MIDIPKCEDFQVKGEKFKCIFATNEGEELIGGIFTSKEYALDDDDEVMLRGMRGTLTMTHDQAIGGGGYYYGEQLCKIFFVKRDIVLTEEDKFELNLSYGLSL